MIDHETSEPEPNPVRPQDASGSLRSLGNPASHVSDESEHPEATDTFESTPIGEYLRRQRMLRGVSIEELAAVTRIPLRSLARLEGGEFDGETDGFVRGFVRTVASAIGLDADDTIARMLQEPTPGVWERHQSSRRLKQSAVGVVLLVAGLISFLILQAGWRLLVGSNADDPSREIVIWRDPVRSLAEATGAEVDPAGEIAPFQGTRFERRVLPEANPERDRVPAAER
jgi:hypothetical protein